MAYSFKPAIVVAGDYYDFLPMEAPRLGVVIGDVEGKGIDAALIMVAVRSFLHFAMEKGVPRLDKTMFKLNQVVCDTERSVTLVLAALNVSEQSLQYCSAGHPVPLVYRTSRSRFLDRADGSAGSMLGVQKDSFFKLRSLKLRRSDIVVFWTDGVTEAARYRDGKRQLFGLERLRNVIRNSAGDDVRDIVDAVVMAIQKFCGRSDMEDDVSVIVLKVD